MCTAPRPDHAHTGPRRGGDQGSRALRRPRLQLHSKMIKAAEKEDACFPIGSVWRKHVMTLNKVDLLLAGLADQK